MRAPVGSPPGPAGASSSFLPSPTSSRLGPEPPLSPPFPHPLCAIFQPRLHPSSDWHGRCWEATAGWDVYFCLPVFCSVCPSCTKWRAFSICFLFWTHTLAPVGGKKKVRLVCGIQRTEVGTCVYASTPNRVALRRRCTAAISIITCAYMQIPTYMHV